MKETSDQLQHSPAKGPYHFFKILLPTYLETLPIPTRFVRKFREELSDVAFLKGPSGRICRVGLKEHDDVVYFSKGWKEFVASHSLSIGYLLVFRYDANSQFNVLIFDSSACEKEYPCATENDEESCSNDGSCTPEKRSDDSIQILDVSKVADTAPDKTRRRRRYKPQLLRSSLRLQSNAMKTKLNSEIMSKNNKNKRKGMRSEEEEILTRSKTQQSKSVKSVGCESLQQVGREDQHLSSKNLGDIECVQSNGKRLTESIHKNVSNCSEEKTPSEPTPIDLEVQSTESSMPSSGERFSIKAENQQPEPDSLSSSSEDIKYFQKQKVGTKSVKGSLHSENMSKTRNLMSVAKQKELIEFTKFKSKHPFFMSMIRASNLRNGPRLQIPTCFIREHLSSRPRCVTLELNGQKWLIGCRAKATGGVFLSSGWTGFFTENRVGEGDVCAFELVNKKVLVFKVTIFPVDEVLPLDKLSRKWGRKTRHCK